MIAIDTETALITDREKAPVIVCCTWAHADASGIACKADGILGHTIEGILTRALSDSALVVMHNGAFDMCVIARAYPQLIPTIFELYARDLVWCTQLAQNLDAIGEIGSTLPPTQGTLSALSERYLGTALDKSEDTWRLRYIELIDTPGADWPEAATDYATRDALTTYDVAVAQMDAGLVNASDVPAQARAAFALQLASCWGFAVDVERSAEFFADLHAQLIPLETAAIDAGLKSRHAKTGKLKRHDTVIRKIVGCALGGDAPLTDKGQVKIDKASLLLAMETGNAPALEPLIEMKAIEKLLTLEKNFQSETVHSSFNPLVSTGRTSSARPNLQNLHRDSPLRSCFIPRQGKVLIACDYQQLELCALAQVCLDFFGASRMADAINAGEDLHSYFALNKNMDRQYAKVANFGFPGGMGHNSFISHAKAYGIDLTLGDAKALKRDWLESFPEMPRYFKTIDHDTVVDGEATLTRGSKRIKGGVSYCEACNYHFQGLSADGAKRALFEVQRACYVKMYARKPHADELSPLYGSRVVNFVHDEIIIECDADSYVAHRAARELQVIMLEEMQATLPDVEVRAQAVIMPRWFKGAEPVLNDRGWLVVCPDVAA